MTKRQKPEPWTYAKLKRKAVCNSADLKKVIIAGVVHSWQGIGLVEECKASEEDYFNYPVITE